MPKETPAQFSYVLHTKHRLYYISNISINTVPADFSKFSQQYAILKTELLLSADFYKIFYGKRENRDTWLCYQMK